LIDVNLLYEYLTFEVERFSKAAYWSRLRSLYISINLFVHCLDLQLLDKGSLKNAPPCISHKASGHNSLFSSKRHCISNTLFIYFITCI